MVLLKRSILLFLTWVSLFINPILAKRSLLATSLVTCMENSQISPSYFNVTFNPDDRSLRYSLDLSTEISSYVIAHVQVYAYGFLIIEKNIDMCTLGWKQFCPIFPGSMQVESIEYISKDYVKMIPGIAYNVPDIDAVVKVIVKDRDSGEELSCIQSGFTNGKTVSQTGAKWATAIIAGLGLLIAAVLSTFGNSNAASHISANAVSLFLYFQSVVVVSMQHVERVPPIASSWAENLAWSMGLIRVTFMQDIFRWYIQSTGGHPTTYFLGTTKQILVQRAMDYLDGMHKFAVRNDVTGFFSNQSVEEYNKRSLDFSLSSNTNTIILRGIERIGFGSHIETTAIVVTGFTFFILCGFLLAVILVLIKQTVELLIRFKKINPNRLNHFRTSFASIMKGALQRYIYIGFTQLIILSLWEFTQNDSPAVIILAIIFLILSLGVIGFSFWKTLQFGKKSIIQYNNPAALLYGDSRILNKYGFCYTMFNANKYWFGIVLTGYSLIKGIFIGLCQYSGKASSLILFILDLAYTIHLFIQAPYLDKSTNVLNYCMSIVSTINSFLFLFFSDLFGQPAQVSSIMGWIFFILNAAFSLILLLMIIVLICLAITSKNPDARFAPAKDDRASFQRKSSVKRKSYTDKGDNLASKEKDNVHNELFALGLAAQDHSNNWELEMYRLHNLSNGADDEDDEDKSSSSENHKSHDILTPSLNQSEKWIANEKERTLGEGSDSDDNKPNNNAGLGAKLKNLTRNLSTKKNNNSPSNANKTSNTPKSSHITRISDTLSPKDEVNSLNTPILNESPKTHQRNYSEMSAQQSMNNNPTDATRIV